MNLDFMVGLCCDGKRIGGKFAEPVWLRDNWAVATDGKILLAARGDGEFRQATFAETQTLSSSSFGLDVLPGDGPDGLDFLEFKKWCGPYDPWKECHRCDGEGELADSDDVTCRECNGDGGTGGDQRPGLLLGYRVDRNALAKFLAGMPDDYNATVKMPKTQPGPGCKATDPIHFHGLDWKLVVAPLSLER